MPGILTDELLAKVTDKIRENRRFTITELSHSFPQVSRTFHEIVTQKLGYHKFCAIWVPKLLADHHKGQWMGAALTFQYDYHRHGDALLGRIITGDETWVQHVTCETKLQFMEWGHTTSPKKPRKCLQTLSARQIMATVLGSARCSSHVKLCATSGAQFKTSAKRFDDDEEHQARVSEWLRSQAADFYDGGISKLVHRYNKCLDLNGDYVEK